MRIPLPSLAETRLLAESICRADSAPLTVALSGQLGSGKTQFVRYFAACMGVSPEDVTSPTYVLLQRYVGKSVIYHFDFYRLDSVAQVWDLGIDELYEQPVWILIEWADKFPACLPPDVLHLELQQDDGGRRWACLTSTGPRSRAMLNAIA